MKETVYLSMGDQYSSHENEYFNEGSEDKSSNSASDNSYSNSKSNSEHDKSEVDEVSFLTQSEYDKVLGELKELLIAVCDFSHDECAKLLTTLAKSKTSVKDKNQKGNDKYATNGSISVFDTVSAKQIYRLSKIIESFSIECEKICTKSPTSLKGAFQYQANKFMNKFHNERKEKLTLILERETWSPAEVEPIIQTFLNHIMITEPADNHVHESTTTKKHTFLTVNDEKYVIVG